MIWYEDEEIRIEFDRKPNVLMRYIYPGMTKDEIEVCNTYPFVNKSPLYVSIYDKVNERFINFFVEKGYSFDGATIPRFLWRLIGSNTQPEFLVASMVHDKLCEHHEIVYFNRSLSSKVFRGLLIESGVKTFKANVMYFFVDIFQALFGGW